METTRGGKREGAGRKSKADEEKVNAIFVDALKVLYDVQDDSEAKTKFIHEKLLTSQRGQLFVAEHIFGKPKETVDQSITLKNFNIKDVVSFDNTQ